MRGLNYITRTSSELRTFAGRRSLHLASPFRACLEAQVQGPHEHPQKVDELIETWLEDFGQELDGAWGGAGFGEEGVGSTRV